MKSMLLSPLAVLAIALAAPLAGESLQDRLDARKAASAERMDEETRLTMEGANQLLRANGAGANALEAGDEASSFLLPNAAGQPVSLDALLAEGPVVMIFYRGAWCPYCNIQLAAMQEHLPALHEAGASLVAISPQAPSDALTAKEKNDLSYHVLSDLNNNVARAYGVTFQMPDFLKDLYQDFGIEIYPKAGEPDVQELPLPAAYVIDQEGIIRYAWIDIDYTKRASPEELVAEAKKAAQPRDLATAP